MALEIVISVAGKLAESLVDPLWRQFQYLFSYHEKKENLKKGIVALDAKRARVQHLIDEAERNSENIEEDVQNWQKSVEEIKEAANLVIENTRNIQMSCFFFRFPNIKSRYSLSCKATKISSEIKNLIEKGQFDKVGYIELENRTTRLLSQDFEKFESRSLTVKEVSEALKDSNVSIIGICGMAGVGKTKLVNEIANLVKVEKSFDDVAIAVVSQNPDFINVQGQLADQLGLKNLAKDSLLERAKQLSQRLDKHDKRILIILDDLWAKLDFASLWIPIKDGQKGLKVILTSRSRDVCAKMGAQRIIEVKLLNRTEAWLLFKEISGISDNNDLKNIAEEVARECGGLPLAIVSIGGTLKNKEKYVWKHVLSQLRKSSVTTIEGTENLVFSRIELSYESLVDKDYKSLLLLCCLFPEDYNIPIEILVRYVKGLQMFNEVETFDETRDKIDTVVNHLKECYLLLPSYDRHVKLHDVVRDVCLSIASKGDHVFMSRHEGLTEWPQIDSVNQFTAISLTFNKMNRLLIDLQCPRLRLLRLLCHHGILPDISMEGMKDLRILELNSLSVQSPLFLQCLTSLRTLCLDYCTLGTETSVIGCLKGLEILSFYRSTLLGFPKEVAQLTNLKLLDLRFDQHHLFPSGIFLDLKKLEELFMGYYKPVNEEEAKQAWIADVKSLSHLTTLQIHAPVGIDFLLQIFRGLDLDKIERFEIINSNIIPRFYAYDFEFQRRLDLRNIEAGNLSENSVSILLKRTENLILEVRGLKNLIPELDKDAFNNLKQLELRSSDLKYITDSTNMAPKYGSIEPLWLSNLRSVSIRGCNAMTSLLRQSISRCFMLLQHLELFDCEMLEEIISIEENTNDKVVEFSKLQTLKLTNLPRFKRFHSRHTSQALLNQVWLPALEALDISSINCPRQIVGCDMPNGSLQKLEGIYILRCSGVACIAKADSLKLLQNLMELWVRDGCDDVEVIFDFGGLKFTTKQTEGLVLLPRLAVMRLEYLPKLASIWRKVPKGIQAFQNLRLLNVLSCHGLKYLLSPPSLAKMLASLESLSVEICKNMEEIMGGEEEEFVDDNIKEFVFPKLSKVRISRLEKLRSFSSREEHELNCPSLTELSIYNCPKLEKFSYGKLSVPSLHRLEIFHCETLEEIISMEKKTDDKVVEFSQLQYLRLCGLSKFKCFQSENTSQALLNQVFLPALETLVIESMNCPRQIVGCNMPNGSLQKLERIDIWNCSGVACIAKVDSLMLLPNLMRLYVGGGCDVEVIFDFEGLKFTAKQTEGLVLLPWLDKLWLDDLPKLASIWRMVPKGIQVFQNLRDLYVWNCRSLKYLLSPPSLAKMLASLHSLSIGRCENMEEIMGGEEVVVDDNIKEFVFPKLSTIRLVNLEKLKSFSSREEQELNFPSLTELRIYNCPQLEKFSYGKLISPMLQKVIAGEGENKVPIDLKDREIDPW